MITRDDFSVHQNHLQDLLKHGLLGPTSQSLWLRKSETGTEICISYKFILLVPELLFWESLKWSNMLFSMHIFLILFIAEEEDKL